MDGQPNPPPDPWTRGGKWRRWVPGPVSLSLCVAYRALEANSKIKKHKHALQFKLGNNLNRRDVIGVRRTVSGLLKLLYPHGNFDKDAVERCLKYVLESRRRVKEQLKKIGGMEFYDVHFSYIDNESLDENFVSVLEQGGDKLIPDGPLNPGRSMQLPWEQEAFWACIGRNCSLPAATVN